MKKLVQTLWACSLLACVPAVFAGEVKTTSPDGRLSVVVQYGEGAPLTWQVQRDGRPVVGVSPLGLVIGGKNIAAGVRPPEPRYRCGSMRVIRFTVSMPRLATAVTRRLIPLRGAGIGYELIVRSYDDGAAVRSPDRFEAETSPRSRADCMESACHGSLFLGALFDRLRKPASGVCASEYSRRRKHWSIR